MIYSAIDIGSNAARLLVADVFRHEKKIIKQKLNLVRIPLRLGIESFLHRSISHTKTAEIVETMQAYKHVMNIYRSNGYYACATSALREAENGREVVQEVFDKTGIRIHIIDGSVEASIIYATQISEQLDPDKNYLYIDVGGGSTEISYFENAELKSSHSFNIGTIRILHNLISKSDYKEMAAWLNENVKADRDLYAIGSGGNINKIHKMSGKSEKKAVQLDFLLEQKEYLSGYTLQERIETLGLRPDRADVIIPALEIYTFIMEKTGIKKIYAPRIGVADGIVHLLFENSLHTVVDNAAEATE